MLSCFQQDLLSSQDATVTKLLDSGLERRQTLRFGGILKGQINQNI